MFIVCLALGLAAGIIVTVMAAWVVIVCAFRNMLG